MNGLRTERVTLEVAHDADDGHIKFRDWDDTLFNEGRNGIRFPGESVRVVEETRGGRLPDMVAWITAERDAAQAERDAARAEAERRLTMCESLKRDRDSADFYVSCLRARVAELEAAPAANAGGGNQLIGLSPAERDGLQVIADGVRRYAHGFIVTASSDEARAVDSVLARHSLAAPPEPRGWLTAEEREAVEQCRLHFVQQEIAFLERNYPDHRWLSAWRRADAALASLLARSSPPRVRRPEAAFILIDGESQTAVRDRMWIAAIREAGGEVE